MNRENGHYSTGIKPAVWLVGISLLFSPQAYSVQVNFEKQVLPILTEKCMDCHKAPYQEGGKTKKPKGDLRLDGARGFILGGENGAVLMAGHPEKSSLYFLTTLPAEDADVMPQKGDLLTKAEQQLLFDWIKEGADFGGWKGNERGLPAERKQTTVELTPLRVDLLGQGMRPVAEAQLHRLRGEGISASAISTENPLLSVSFVPRANETDDSSLAELSAVSSHITQLFLARSKVTDAGMERVARMPMLTRLDLNTTGITDAGLAKLRGLENLESLNLHHTKVSDQGLKYLASMKSLKQVFLWSTEVSPEGVKALRKHCPELNIHHNLAFHVTQDAGRDASDALSARYDKGSCCSKARNNGKDCPHSCCKAAASKGQVCVKCNPGAR